MEEPRGLLVGLQQAIPLGAAALIIRILFQLGKGHVQLIGQVLDRLLELQTLNVHDELDDAAAGLAAEAVVHLPFLIDGK